MLREIALLGSNRSAIQERQEKILENGIYKFNLHTLGSISRDWLWKYDESRRVSKPHSLYQYLRPPFSFQEKINQQWNLSDVEDKRVNQFDTMWTDSPRVAYGSFYFRDSSLISDALCAYQDMPKTIHYLFGVTR